MISGESPDVPSDARWCVSLAVACPVCQREVVWAEASRYRPFCSERCKLLDLGQWANEAYRVSTVESPDHFES